MAEAASVRKLRAPLLWVAALTLVLGLALGLYLARTAIAEHAARAWLAERHVPAGVEIRALSLTGLSAKVSLGPPEDPDFAVERMYVGYGLAWNGHGFSIATRSLALFRPRLKVRLVDGKLSFGALEPLLRELARQPAGKGPAPDVTVRDGVAWLTTPGGVVSFHGDGAGSTGAITAIDGRVAPFALTLATWRLRGAGTEVHVARRGDRLAATISGGPFAASMPGVDVGARTAALTAELTSPSGGRFAGPVRLTLTANGVAGSAPRGRASGGSLNAVFSGALDADTARQRLSGHLTATGQGAAIAATGATARQGDARFDLAQVAVSRDATGLTAQLGGSARMEAKGLRIGLASLDDTVLTVQVSGAQLHATAAGWSRAATLHGAMSGRGALSAGAARHLTETLPVLSGEPGYRAATQRALTAFRVNAPAIVAVISPRSARLGLAAPLVVESNSGARLTLTGQGAAAGPASASGSGALALSGGGFPTLRADFARWSVAPSGVEADLAVRGALDASLARGADIDAKGRLSMTRARVRFNLTDCASISAQRLALEPNPISDFAGRLCPGAGPLIETTPQGWRAQGRLEAAHALAPTLAANLTDAQGAFQAAGQAGGLATMLVTLDRGRIADTTDPARFRPLRASGSLALAHGAWVGDLAVATAAGRPVAKLHVRHDGASGVGRVDIDARQLAFASGGLQPAELTPLASFAKDAAGPAAFSGWFTWAPQGPPSSGGELVTKGLRFRSPTGAVLDVDSDLRFTSLAPLVSAADQTLAVREVQGVLPLKGVSAVFDFNDSGVSLHAASAGFASGAIRLEPMTVPFASGSAYKGVLVMDHVNLGQIIAASNLAHVMRMDAVVNARIPFETGPSGIRIASGELSAVAPGRLSIARAAFGAGAASGQAQPAAQTSAQGGLARDLAYQAMENLAFDKLDARLDSVADDRLRILFHIKGRHDPPKKTRATISVGDLIDGKALSKPITLPSGTQIDLTLDTSLNFGELVRALGDAWRESLGTPPQARSAPVQDGSALLSAK